MNKKIIALAIVAGSAFTSVAQAADGTINFTGTITDTACTVSTATKNQTVDLGTVSKTAFAAAGDTAAPTKFSIVLQSCPTTVTNASVRFDGPIDSVNSNLLALTSATGNAAHVAVGIYEQDASTLIPIATKSASKPVSSTADTTLNFIAKYVATAAGVTSGPANAATNFTISYP
ncbi:fimbrial protein [Rouxiella sp. Mn2063]|uniref:fimbrial protein n=1 Tax=Rouxiella sp. Mn2063 TaxID=3395262 RepID=UPI003BD58B62